MTPEGRIQSHLMKLVKAVGGFCRKLAWEGRAGAPDLIIIINGKIVFVEVKRPGGKPKPHQVREHERMAKRGADVRVIDNIHDADLLVADLVASSYSVSVATKEASYELLQRMGQTRGSMAA